VYPARCTTNSQLTYVQWISNKLYRKSTKVDWKPTTNSEHFKMLHTLYDLSSNKPRTNRSSGVWAAAVSYQRKSANIAAATAAGYTWLSVDGVATFNAYIGLLSTAQDRHCRYESLTSSMTLVRSLGAVVVRCCTVAYVTFWWTARRWHNLANDWESRQLHSLQTRKIPILIHARWRLDMEHVYVP